MDFSPLWISLKVAVCATVFTFFLGLLSARLVISLRRGKALIDGIFSLPMVLPPTVVGFFLLIIFGKNSLLGGLLLKMGISVLFTWQGAVIAAVVVSFPIMYRTARGALEQVDVNLIYAARTLGMPEYKIFWKVAVPSAGPGLVAGTILTFARALGEYGATSMLAGNIPGKTGTISQRIAMVIQDGDYQTAGVWVGIVILIAFGIVVLMNLAFGKGMKHTKQW